MHALLLSLEGRLAWESSCEARPSHTDAERTGCLQSAIVSIVDGDPKKVAMTFLERALENAPHDSLLALAARIELEQLR